MDLESAVDRAFLDCTCPYCSIHLEEVGVRDELVRNIWRHHIVTAHPDGAENGD